MSKPIVTIRTSIMIDCNGYTVEHLLISSDFESLEHSVLSQHGKSIYAGMLDWKFEQWFEETKQHFADQKNMQQSMNRLQNLLDAKNGKGQAA
jgi:hypothetical protein